MISRLNKDGVVVIDIDNAQIHWQLGHPGRSAMVLSTYGEIKPLDLLKVHGLVGHNLTWKI